MKNKYLQALGLFFLGLFISQQMLLSQCAINEVNTTLSIQLDQFGEETLWEIYSVETGLSVGFGGPYANESGTTVTEQICLPQGCYDIVLFDTAGDGFCCDFGNGSYTVSIPGQNLLTNIDGQFFDSKVETFCIGLNIGGAGCTLGLTVDSTPTSCGTEDGLATINAFGGNGSYQYRTELTAWSSNNEIDDLPVGVHEAYVRNANGTCITGPVLFTTTEDCINQPCTDNLVNLNIVMDDFPEEVVWELFSNDTTTLFSGGPYQNNNNFINKNMCLPDGCYTLVISDIAQNGLCCESGNGSYSIAQNGTVLAQGNGLYTDGEAVSFCVGNSGPAPTGIVFTMRAMLQGALLNSPTFGSMRDDLRTQNLIPLQEPYSTLPAFQHVGNGGGESIPQAALSFDDPQFAIVDWGFLEIRSSTNPSQVIATKSVLFSKNGTIVDSDGVEFIEFPTLVAGKYYVALRHRNHLGVMLSEPLGLANIPVAIDFTSPEIGLWGNNARVDLGQGLMALWAGNCNLSQEVIFQGNDNDVNNVFFEVLGVPANTGFQANYINIAYSNNDVNMDGQIIYQGNNNEPNFIFFNALGHPNNGQFSSNYIILEQLP